MKNDFFGVDDFSGTVDRKGVGTVDRGEDRDMVDVTENDESHQKKGIKRCFQTFYYGHMSWLIRSTAPRSGNTVVMCYDERLQRKVTLVCSRVAPRHHR